MSYVWTLMLIVVEAEPFELAIQALAEPGSVQRGTGLEYLEHVLPANLMRVLRPLLAEPELVAESTRPHVSILSELMGHRGHNEGDLAAVGCMVDSCRTCAACKEGEEQFCEAPATFTYNGEDVHLGGVTYGGYSDSLVVDEAFVLRVPNGMDLAGIYRSPVLATALAPTR